MSRIVAVAGVLIATVGKSFHGDVAALLCFIGGAIFAYGVLTGEERSR